jgi:hypothetical protein
MDYSINICSLLCGRVRGHARRISQRVGQVPLFVVAGLHALDDLRHASVEHTEVRLRVQTDPERPGDQRQKDGDLAPRSDP